MSIREKWRRNETGRKKGRRNEKKAWMKRRTRDIICSVLASLSHVLGWRYLYYIHSLNSFKLIVFINAIHSFGRWKINSLSGCIEPCSAKSYQPTLDAFMQNFVIRICDGEKWWWIMGLNNSHSCSSFPEGIQNKRPAGCVKEFTNWPVDLMKRGASSFIIPSAIWLSFGLSWAFIFSFSKQSKYSNSFFQGQTWNKIWPLLSGPAPFFPSIYTAISGFF